MPRRGRRPAGSDAAADILDAARARFAAQGFSASLREIADDAGVNVRLVSHYFGSKEDLFAAAVELPIDVSQLRDVILHEHRDHVSRRLAEFIVATISRPEVAQTMTGLLRAAASEPHAATMVRERLLHQLLLPIAEALGTDHAELRASLAASQIGGLLMARHIIQLPALASTGGDTLAAMLAPVLEHYFTSPMPGTAGPETG